MKISNKHLPKTDKFTGTTIGDEWSGEDNTSSEHSCPWCSRTLVKLIDHSHQNPSLFCSYCKTEHIPEETRKKSKLNPQRTEIEPAVASVGNVPDVSIRKEIQLKDGALALSKKGTIRFTSYQES
jgi:hypothetical protein